MKLLKFFFTKQAKSKKEIFKIFTLVFGLSIGLIFCAIDKYLTLFQAIQEFSVDVRFQLSKFQMFQSSGDHLSQLTINPDAHEAIQIIGIDNATVSEYGGFPFAWTYYSKLLHTLGKSEYNQVMFDIFFLDENKDKENLCLLPNKNKQQEKSLSSILKDRNNKVLVDYPFETKIIEESVRKKIGLDKRIQDIEKYQIKNIIPTQYNNGPEWVTYPEVPISAINKNLDGLGYANIRKQSTGINRTIPLVIKWKNNIYPSISLLLALNYFKVDLKDVEVKLGSYIKIKNISTEPILKPLSDENGLPIFDENKKRKTEPQDRMAKPNRDRMITIPIDEEGFMYINFIGSASSFPSIPFNVVANNPDNYFQGAQDSFKDKILLVGIFYATGVAKDIHATPFSSDIAGIEHHAHALNTILKQDFLYYAPKYVDYIIYMILGLILGILIPYLSIRRISLYVFIFVVLFLIEVFYVFNTFNLVHTFLIPYLEIAIILVVCLGYRVIFEESNVAYIKSTFSKFVAKNVVHELLNNPELLKLGGDKKELTVFFSDIRGFTTLSENLSPEKLVMILNQYLSVMTGICLAYKGTIDKYMGDAIMAFWGAPIDEPEHAYLSCLASLEQMKALQKLTKEWKEEGVPVIDIGIGLNTGDMVVGNIGSEHRMDYTVMGDAVNLGSRLEGANKMYGTHIIISESTYLKVKDRVFARELDTVKVKGKNEPIRIYELIDIKDQEDFIKYQVQHY